MKNAVDRNIGFVMKGHKETRKDVCEVKEILRRFYCSMGTLKIYGMTNVVT